MTRCKSQQLQKPLGLRVERTKPLRNIFMQHACVTCNYKRLNLVKYGNMHFKIQCVKTYAN